MVSASTMQYHIPIHNVQQNLLGVQFADDGNGDSAQCNRCNLIASANQ